MTTILVKKRSTWEQYQRNREAFGRMTSASVSRLKASHERHAESVRVVSEALEKVEGRVWVVEGADIQFSTSPGDTVICVGGDGTFLSSSHAVGEYVGIIGFNSDPKFSRGRFCVGVPTDSGDLQSLLKRVVSHRAKSTLVPRMTVQVDDTIVSNQVLNEILFSHSCPAAMTRFELGSKRVASSGIWIGTGAGSTGALRSAGGKVFALTNPNLQAIVREPCEENKKGHISLVQTSFKFTSKTADGTIYMDGAFLRHPVGFDQVIRCYTSSEPLMMLGPVPK